MLRVIAKKGIIGLAVLALAIAAGCQRQTDGPPAVEQAGSNATAPERGDGAHPEVPPHGNGLEPSKPGDSSAKNSEPVTYSSASFRKRVQVSAHLDHDVLRPGDAFRLAVVFEIEKGWHIYGNPVGPGIGKATVIAAHSPDGFQFDTVRYAPGEKEEQDFGEAGSTWVWQNTGKTVHYLTGKVSEKVQPGEYEWTFEAFAQVCDPKTCLPGKAIVRIPITVAPQGTPSNPTNEEFFAGFSTARVPQNDVDQ